MSEENQDKLAPSRGAAVGFILGVILWAALITLLCGCMRDQAVAAANITDLAERVSEVDEVTPTQDALLDGIVAESEAVHRTLEPSAPSTTAPIASPVAAAREARRHAGTVRTPAAQIVGDAGDMLGGIGGALAPIFGGGALSLIAGWLLGKRAQAPVISAAIRFGQAAIDRLAEKSPEDADAIKRAESDAQERMGVREKVRKAKKKALRK
jgi:hypothetical protein